MEGGEENKSAHRMRKALIERAFPSLNPALDSKYRVIGTYLFFIIYCIWAVTLVLSLLVQSGAIRFPRWLLVGGFIDEFINHDSGLPGMDYQIVIAVSMTLAVIGWVSVIVGSKKYNESPSRVSEVMKAAVIAFDLFLLGAVVFFACGTIIFYASGGPIALGPFTNVALYNALLFLEIPVLVCIVLFLLVLTRKRWYHLVLIMEIFLTIPVAIVVFGFGSLADTSFAAINLLKEFLSLYLNSSGLWVPTVFMALEGFFSSRLVIDAKDWASRRIGKKGGYLFASFALLYVFYTQLYPLTILALSWIIPAAASFAGPAWEPLRLSVENYLIILPLMAYALLKLHSRMVSGQSNPTQAKARLLISAGFIILISVGLVTWEPTLAALGQPDYAPFYSYEIVSWFLSFGTLIAFFAFLVGFASVISALRKPERASAQVPKRTADVSNVDALTLKRRIGLFAALALSTLVAGISLFVFVGALF